MYIYIYIYIYTCLLKLVSGTVRQMPWGTIQLRAPFSQLYHFPYSLASSPRSLPGRLSLSHHRRSRKTDPKGSYTSSTRRKGGQIHRQHAAREVKYIVNTPQGSSNTSSTRKIVLGANTCPKLVRKLS